MAYWKEGGNEFTKINQSKARKHTEKFELFRPKDPIRWQRMLQILSRINMQKYRESVRL